jgi:hypothetical protein
MVQFPKLMAQKLRIMMVIMDHNRWQFLDRWLMNYSLKRFVFFDISMQLFSQPNVELVIIELDLKYDTI